MNLHDFEYFNVLGDLLSFTAASNYFEVSQPTITYAVKRLERYYECNLIHKDPSHRSVVLTDEGKILKIHIENILEEISLTQRAIDHSKKKQYHIGLPPIIRAKILAHFLNNDKNIKLLSNFNLEYGGSEELLCKLLSGNIEFSLIGSINPLTHSNLIVKQLYKQEFYIFVSKENPLAAFKEISFKKALDYPFVVLDESFVHMKAFKNLNEKYKNKAKIIFNFSDIHTIGQLVKSNVGITLMTDVIPLKNMSNLIKIPLIREDRQSFFVQYAYLKSTPLNSDLKELISLLDEMIN